MKALIAACMLLVGCIGPEPTVTDWTDAGDDAQSVDETPQESIAADSRPDASPTSEASESDAAPTRDSGAVVESPCDGPIFSPPGGAFKGPVSVSISTQTRDATIFYTTDGTAPTRDSRVFTTALALVSTTVLRAFCTATGYADSGISEAIFQIGESDPGDPCADGGGAC